MQPFVCPQCGYKSAFDPWVESARCPKCGYIPLEGSQPPPPRPAQESPAETPAVRWYTCPCCGYKSLILRGAPLRCLHCGHQPQDGEDQAEDVNGDAAPPPTGASGPLTRLGNSLKGLPILALGDARLALSILFLIIWGLWLLSGLGRDVKESVGHKLQLMFSATSTTEGQVVEREARRLQRGKGPSNYYLTYRYTATGADGRVQEFTNRERVKWSLYRKTELGSTVTVRYARRDPEIASLQGNEGLCIGTTGITVLFLLVILLTLYVWTSQ